MQKLPIAMVLGAVAVAACSADSADMMASMLRDAAQLLDDAGPGQAEAAVPSGEDGAAGAEDAAAAGDAKVDQRPPHQDLTAACSLEGKAPDAVSKDRYAYAEVAVAAVGSIRSVYLCEPMAPPTGACDVATCGFRPPAPECVPGSWTFTKGKVYVACGVLRGGTADERYRTAHVVVD